MHALVAMFGEPRELVEGEVGDACSCIAGDVVVVSEVAEGECRAAGAAAAASGKPPLLQVGVPDRFGRAEPFVSEVYQAAWQGELHQAGP